MVGILRIVYNVELDKRNFLEGQGQIMPLPTKLNKEILSSFEDLNNEGNELIVQMEPLAAGWGVPRRLAPVCISEFRTLAVKSRSLIGRLFGDSTDGKTYRSSIDDLTSCIASTQEIVGILRGLKESYEKGFLIDCRNI